jgi:hypothetical protein
MKQPKLGRAIKTLPSLSELAPPTLMRQATITKQKRENKLLVTLEQLSHWNSYHTGTATNRQKQSTLPLFIQSIKLCINLQREIAKTRIAPSTLFSRSRARIATLCRESV